MVYCQLLRPNKIWGAGAIPGNSYVSLERPLNPQVAHSVSQCTGLFCLPQRFPHHFGLLGIHRLEYLSLRVLHWQSFSRRVAVSLWLIIPVNSRFYSSQLPSRRSIGFPPSSIDLRAVFFSPWLGFLYGKLVVHWTRCCSYQLSHFRSSFFSVKEPTSSSSFRNLKLSFPTFSTHFWYILLKYYLIFTITPPLQ